MLLFHGNPGIGKTRLCAALSEWMLKFFNTQRYHKELNLLKKLREGIGDGRGDYIAHLELMIDDDVVVLDDVGSGINPEKSTYRDLEFRREVFFAFLDERYNTMKPTIITSNFSRGDFRAIYSERIESRLFASENTIISLFGEAYVDLRTQGK